MNNITTLQEANCLIARLQIELDGHYESLNSHKVSYPQKVYEGAESLSDACYIVSNMDADIKRCISLIEKYCWNEETLLRNLNFVAKSYNLDIQREYPIFVGYSLWNSKTDLTNRLCNAKRNLKVFHTVKQQNLVIKLIGVATEEKFYKNVTDCLNDPEIESVYTEKSQEEVKKAAAVTGSTWAQYNSTNDARAGVMGIMKQGSNTLVIICPPKNCFTLLGGDKILAVTKP